MAVRSRRRAATTTIEAANRKPDADFVAAYLEPGAPGLPAWTSAWAHPRTGAAYRVSLVRSAHVGDAVLSACFALVEATSRADYDASAQRWRPADKRREMREADLRYILVRPASEANGRNDNDGSDIHAFASLMPTFEAGEPVVYCYEIHLQPELRGTGLGAHLLGLLSVVAHNLPPVTKVMLTCFRTNAGALRFYEKQGFALDATSPVARTLRGTTVEPDYAILSKPVRR
ncbi:gcn5-related n-acetyltransferase [Niveomyces insectorum RCEF 264]|uniref:N-alpha-acetyltransferase 40 n=1 Tax=Niveomyces insectorum RCEF 264 TaxID=1081102 RepID=A0A162K588_9HYPO|nr:gcn5-related n-acetyltransferase [Niveomyces insectorum RCEF 264]